jgi:hypothetical protein
MIAPAARFLVAGMMRFCDAVCKDQGGAHARTVAVKLNPPEFASVAKTASEIKRLRLA